MSEGGCKKIRLVVNYTESFWKPRVQLGNFTNVGRELGSKGPNLVGRGEKEREVSTPELLEPEMSALTPQNKLCASCPLPSPSAASQTCLSFQRFLPCPWRLLSQGPWAPTPLSARMARAHHLVLRAEVSLELVNRSTSPARQRLGGREGCFLFPVWTCRVFPACGHLSRLCVLHRAPPW